MKFFLLLSITVFVFMAGLNAEESHRNYHKGEKNCSAASVEMVVYEDEDPALDTIVLLGGRKLLVHVRKLTRSTIFYAEPGETQSKEVRRKDVLKILYKSGKVEVLNKPVLQMVDELQWEAVYLTSDKSEVEGLFERGKIASEASTSVRSKKAAKRSATVRLQKKAAAIGANVVLVTREESIGGYGDLPGYEMAGIAYSFEPPEVSAPEETE